MIAMIQSPPMVVAARDGDQELALVDSGSGVAACPKEYALEIPLLLPGRDPLPTASVAGEPIEVCGQKVEHYILDNGEGLAIAGA